MRSFHEAGRPGAGAVDLQVDRRGAFRAALHAPAPWRAEFHFTCRWRPHDRAASVFVATTTRRCATRSPAPETCGREVETFGTALNAWSAARPAGGLPAARHLHAGDSGTALQESLNKRRVASVIVLTAHARARSRGRGQKGATTSTRSVRRTRADQLGALGHAVAPGAGDHRHTGRASGPARPTLRTREAGLERLPFRRPTRATPRTAHQRKPWISTARGSARSGVTTMAEPSGSASPGPRSTTRKYAPWTHASGSRTASALGRQGGRLAANPSQATVCVEVVKRYIFNMPTA